MWDLLSMSSCHLKATSLPSGEKLGSASNPGRAVKGTDVKAGADVFEDEKTNLRTPAVSPIPASKATAKGNHPERLQRWRGAAVIDRSFETSKGSIQR